MPLKTPACRRQASLLSPRVDCPVHAEPVHETASLGNRPVVYLVDFGVGRRVVVRVEPRWLPALRLACSSRSMMRFGLPTPSLLRVGLPPLTRLRLGFYLLMKGFVERQHVPVSIPPGPPCVPWLASTGSSAVAGDAAGLFARWVLPRLLPRPLGAASRESRPGSRRVARRHRVPLWDGRPRLTSSLRRLCGGLREAGGLSRRLLRQPSRPLSRRASRVAALLRGGPRPDHHGRGHTSGGPGRRLRLACPREAAGPA